jgi:hypothetical protein
VLEQHCLVLRRCRWTVKTQAIEGTEDCIWKVPWLICSSFEKSLPLKCLSLELFVMKTVTVVLCLSIVK